MLLAASCIFYMAFIPKYILILAFTIIIDYIAGIMIEKAAGRKRKIFLVVSIISNVGILAFFKYYNFFIDNISDIFHFLDLNAAIPALKIILPIGLSFHTFQAMSYTIEVYMGRQKAEKNFGVYALYVMFFPQLVAGPIERPQNLLHQFYEKHDFNYNNAVSGLRMMLWGFFLKIVVADRLAIFVNDIYNHAANYSGLPLLLSTYFFAFQIYGDFAGYSFIAIGAAKVMGFKLMDNFKRPYFSQSISEFWKRWHISLSSWFKDYLYIPMGGNRVKKSRWLMNLFIVFLVSGFWHGAGWNFIIWGSLHGFYLIFSILTENFRNSFVGFIKLTKFPKLHKAIKILITFNLVSFSWIFFRANSLSDAMHIITHLFSGFLSAYNYLIQISILKDILLGLFAVLFMEMIHIIQEKISITQFINNKHMAIRWAIYFIMIFGILLFGVFEEMPFIYFQF
jgi:D-alanyl-lipoteichoic acid acyltransferase DltB (MBOAT superfamily)